MIADIQSGGLKMPHFESIIHSQKLMWIKRLLIETTTISNWQTLAWTNISLTRDMLLSKYSIDFISTKSCPSSFYRQVLMYWYSFYSKEPEECYIKHENLWYNKFILIANKPVCYSDWKSAGITKLNDIFDNGSVLTKEQLHLKYNLPIKTMTYNSLIQAIPMRWKKQELLSTQDKTQNGNPLSTIYVGHKCYDINTITSNKLYWHILENTTKSPTAVDKWIDQFPFLNDQDFQSYFNLIPSSTKETKMQVFQYKIMHRIFPCEYQLHLWKIVEDAKCEHCSKIDTISHYFYECPNSLTFWKHVEKWVINNIHQTIKLTKTDIIFGIPTKNKDYELCYLNYIIVHGKWYLYQRKLNQSILCFLDYLIYLKQKLIVERYTYSSKGDLERFNCKLGHLYDALFL